MECWLFQADPKKWAIDDALKENPDELWWEVNQYRRRIHAGDHVVLWKAGRSGGIYATGEVKTDPREVPISDPHWAPSERARAEQPKPRVLVRISRNLVSTPIERLMVQSDPALRTLSVLRFPRGTNFVVTEEQWARVVELAGGAEDQAKAKRNPPWTRDELILALELYFRCDPLHTSEANPEIVELSRILNSLPIHSDRPDASRFRNPSGVYMKLCNFLRLDPGYSGKGLDAGSKMDEVVWNEFATDRERLTAVAVAIRAQAGSDQETQGIVVDEDFEAPEGQVLLRQHRIRERSGTLSRRKKQLARQNGSYVCEVCGFDGERKLFPLSDAAIECHHKTPLSQIRPGQRIGLGDLMLVCANCHRMLHAGGDAVTMRQKGGVD